MGREVICIKKVFVVNRVGKGEGKKKKNAMVTNTMCLWKIAFFIFQPLSLQGGRKKTVLK